MIVLKVLDDAELVLADLEVNLGKQIRHAVTLCVRQNGNITPLNTPDGRPIQMREENTIQTIEETFDDDEVDEVESARRTLDSADLILDRLRQLGEEGN